MAKDDSGEKTEDPTPKRREEAREKGQVPKSQDLGSALLMLLGFASIKLLGPWLGTHILNLFATPFKTLNRNPGTDADTYGYILQGSITAFLTLLPLIIILFITAFSVIALQVGFHLSPKAFELDPNKLNPISGFKKIVGMRGLMKMLTGVAKIAIVGVVLFIVISAEMPTIMNFFGQFDYQTNTTWPLVIYIVDMLCWIGIYAGATLTIIAVVDYAYQKWQHTQDIKMSKQEVKEEMKNMEGDPQMKAKRLQRAREMAGQRMQDAVPEADVVVTNPTHYSCALRYRDQDPAPRLLTKGVDRMALRIRELASEHGVPIVEKPELARALHRWVEIDEFIPDKYWASVAEVLAYVYQMDEKKKQRALGAEQEAQI